MSTPQTQTSSGIAILKQGKDFIGNIATWMINTMAKNPRLIAWMLIITIVIIIIMIIVIIVLANRKPFYAGGSSNLATGSNNSLWFQGNMDAGKGGNLDRDPTPIQMGLYDPGLRQMTEPWRYGKKTTDFADVATNFNETAIPEAMIHDEFGVLGQNINELDVLGSGQKNKFDLNQISRKIQEVKAF